MRRGFTLAEMLIALALTALAIGIISEGVRRSLDFQRQLDAFRTERESQSAALEAVRGRLERLLPAVRAGEEEGQSRLFFVGEANQMVFLAADAGYPSRAGVYEYRLEVLADDEEAGTSPALIVSRRSLIDLDQFNRIGENAQSWSLPLGSPVSFGYAEAGGTPSASWRSRDDYPALIILQEEGVDLPAMSIALPRAVPELNPEDTGADTMPDGTEQAQ